MKVIDQSFEIMDTVDRDKILQNLERYGRTCYKSEHNIGVDTAARFIKGIIKSGHESVIEHEKITVKIITNRGVSHEMVRHRLASYSQESTRYCNYTKDKFGNELTFIKPFFEKEENFVVWDRIMQQIENHYFGLIGSDATPDEARSILPNSLKTEIVVTMNLREWRHFFKLRTSMRAHAEIREISTKILKRFQELLPEIFGDIVVM